MKNKISKNFIRNILVWSILVISVMLNAQATLEFTAGAGNPTDNGPRVENQVITLQKNTNNPTGNTFAAYTPTTTATFSLTNQQRSMAVPPGVGLMFGGTASNTSSAVNTFALFPLVNGAGSPANANFTSANSTAGTGIDVTANRNVALYISSRPLYEIGAALPTVGNPIRHQYADLVITFNRAVNNPIIHFAGCGGSIGLPGTYHINFTPEFELITSGLSLTRLSGSTEFSVPNSTEILNSAALPNATTGAGAMSGSVMVNGNNITSVTFRVYIKGVHPNQGQPIFWQQAATVQSGDVFTMGVSLSDCLAGTTAPTLSGTTITNTCLTTTVNLNSLHTGAAPTGSTLVWFTNNAHTGAAYATPTAAVADTYYAFYYDAANNCYSPASNTVIATINSCNIDSDGDGITDDIDLDDDNDGILDADEGYCNLKSDPILDGFDAPLATNLYDNLNATLTSFNGWTNQNGGSFNIVRVNGSPYIYGPDNAQNGTQYIDIAFANDFPIREFTINGGAVITASAWFSNRDPLALGGGTYTPWTGRMEVLDPSNNVVAQGNLLPFTSTTSEEIWFKSEINNASVVGNGIYKLRLYVDDWGHVDNVSFCISSDSDGDGTPNHLDLDSDNDGCLDAIEGGAAITTSQLVNSGGTVIVGTGSTATNQNLCATSTCVDANGVPTIVSGGQSIGDSQNIAIKGGCFCYKPAATGGTVLETKHGISAMGRAGADNGNWPMVRKGAWTVLESKEKGFVINRVPTTAALANITGPVEGMMVYDEEADCLKIYTIKEGEITAAWHCMSTQACPD